MASTALENFWDRSQEVKQLIDAHSALTRIRKAEAAMKSSNNSMQAIGEVVKHLVSQPGPGRPHEVHALNSAGVALLSGHLQGYFTDLYIEVSTALLSKSVLDMAVLIKANEMRGNPNEANITKLFRSLGFEDILADISWKGMNNESVRKKLRAFNELRNKIVHGKAQKVSKAQLAGFFGAFNHFAEAVDDKVRKDVHSVTGKFPWKPVSSN